MSAGISLLSFLENNPGYEPDEVFFVDFGLHPINKKKLDGIATRYSKHVTFLDARQVTAQVRRDFPHLRSWRGTMAPNAKCFMDLIVPEYVERLLFIDADTLVVGSVDELSHMDMGGAALAAVPQCWETCMIRLGRLKLYADTDMYFNSGVLLYDMNVWRRENCHQMIVDTLRVKKQFYSPDQTLLNNAIPGRLLCRLPLKYNHLTHWMHPRQELKFLSVGGIHTVQEIDEMKRHPVIIHYTGGDHHARPWHKGCRSYRTAEYPHYKALSPWKEVALFPRQTCTRQGVAGKGALLYFWMASKQPSLALTTAVMRLNHYINRLQVRWHKAQPPVPEGVEA